MGNYFVDIRKTSPALRCAAGRGVKLALLASTLLVTSPALAQDEEVVTPFDLFDGGKTEGLRIAPGLVLRPSVQAQLEHDSNVYNLETGKLDDIVAIVKPALFFQTELNRHYSELRASGEFRRYADISAENSEQFEISGLTQLDLGSRVGLQTQGGVARRIERRGTAGDQFFTDEPVEYRAAWANAELSRTGGILELFAGGGIDDLDYSNTFSGGVPIDLTDRDVQILKGHARAQYAVGPTTKFFVEGEYNAVNYDLVTAVPRDSDGFSVLAGIQYEISALIDAEAAIGFARQNFDDPAVATANGVDFSLALSWTPTPRWQFTASGERAIDASPLSNVPAILRTQFELGALTVVSDRVLLELKGGFQQEDYRSTARTDDRYFLNFGSQYRVTDNIGATAYLGYRKQSTNVVAQSYDGVAVGVGLTLRM